jgi:tRNA A-37 threonylcarbamoyl transferase component Bud32
MDKILKELKGYSGSKVYLMQNDCRLFIRKEGNVERNYERLRALYDLGYNVPLVYSKDGEVLDMEYIHGLDMKNYLKTNSTENLTHFIAETICKFAKWGIDKDYTQVYNKKLSWIDSVTDLPFTKDELISKLPKVLPQSEYHGDLTLENIIHCDDDKFYLIDAVTIEYDSWVFDLAKLRQDLECKWFLRKDNLMLDVKLKNIQDKLLRLCSLADNDYLLILMLLRVYLHAPKDSLEYKFIMREINRLWK